MEFVALLLVIITVIKLQQYLYRKYTYSQFEYRCFLNTPEVVEQDEVELIEEISNRKWLPIPWLKSEITTSKWLDFAGAQSVVTDKTRFVPSFFMLKSYQKIQRSWKVTCLKRGEFQIQKVVLVSTDLLGSLNLSQPVEVKSEILVLPKALDLENDFFSPKYLSGDVIVRRRLLQDPFWIAGVQEYTQREPMNRIHWAASVKEQRLMVYENESTSQQSLSVILNMQSKEFETNEVGRVDEIETAIRVCAAIFENTLQQQIPVRLFVNGKTGQGSDSVVSGEYWGEQHILDLKRILARLQLVSTYDFPTYLNELDNVLTASDIVLVTAYLNQDIYQFVRNQKRKGTFVKIFVTGLINSADVAEDCEIFCLPNYFEDNSKEG